MLQVDMQSSSAASHAQGEDFDFSKQSIHIHKLQLERVNDIKLIKQTCLLALHVPFHLYQCDGTSFEDTLLIY